MAAVTALLSAVHWKNNGKWSRGHEKNRRNVEGTTEVKERERNNHSKDPYSSVHQDYKAPQVPSLPNSIFRKESKISRHSFSHSLSNDDVPLAEMQQQTHRQAPHASLKHLTPQRGSQSLPGKKSVKSSTGQATLTAKSSRQEAAQGAGQQRALS